MSAPDDPTAPAAPLQVVAADPEGWCDPESGVCALPDRGGAADQPDGLSAS